MEKEKVRALFEEFMEEKGLLEKKDECQADRARKCLIPLSLEIIATNPELCHKELKKYSVNAKNGRTMAKDHLWQYRKEVGNERLESIKSMTIR